MSIDTDTNQLKLFNGVEWVPMPIPEYTYEFIPITCEKEFQRFPNFAPGASLHYNLSSLADRHIQLSNSYLVSSFDLQNYGPDELHELTRWHLWNLVQCFQFFIDEGKQGNEIMSIGTYNDSETYGKYEEATKHGWLSDNALIWLNEDKPNLEPYNCQIQLVKGAVMKAYIPFRIINNMSVFWNCLHSWIKGIKWHIYGHFYCNEVPELLIKAIPKDEEDK